MRTVRVWSEGTKRGEAHRIRNHFGPDRTIFLSGLPHWDANQRSRRALSSRDSDGARVELSSRRQKDERRTKNERPAESRGRSHAAGRPQARQVGGLRAQAHRPGLGNRMGVLPISVSDCKVPPVDRPNSRRRRLFHPLLPFPLHYSPSFAINQISRGSTSPIDFGLLASRKSDCWIEGFSVR